MATKKITQLPAASSVIATDLVPIVDDPSGTAVTQKATWSLVRDYVLGVSGGVVIFPERGRFTSTTAQQLSVRYDGSNMLDIDVSSAGAVTYNATGASAGHAFSDTVTVPTLVATATSAVNGGVADINATSSDASGDAVSGLSVWAAAEWTTGDNGVTAISSTAAKNDAGAGTCSLLRAGFFTTSSVDSASATTSAEGIRVLVSTGATAYGVISSVSGAGTTNYAGHFNAQGAGTNYALYTTNGLVRFGDAVTVASGGITVTGNSTITGTLGGVTTLTATTLAGTLSTATQNSVTTMTGLTTIGTLVAGAVPASLVTAGTFGSGAYNISAGSTTNALTVTTTGAIQQSLRYDGSNRLDVSVSGGGAITYDAVGGTAEHIFSDPLRVNATGGLALSVSGNHRMLIMPNDSGSSAAGKTIEYRTDGTGADLRAHTFLVANGNFAGEFAFSTTADDTYLLVFDYTGAQMKRVSRGAADSGGTGYRLLRIPN